MYLLFDIGGTNMRLAISKDGRTFENEKIVSTPLDFHAGISSLKKAALEISDGKQLVSAAGGVRGPLDKEKAMFVANSILPDWTHQPLKAELEKVLDTSVYLENDAALAGLGEAIKGSGMNYRIIAYITIGTGVGGVRIVDKKIDANSFGFEPGHQIILADGNLCGCGGKGHLEAYVSGFAIEKIYGQKPEQISDSKIWDEVVKNLAVGLNNTIVHWSPDIVVLGGSVMKSISLEKVKNYLKEIVTISPKLPEISLDSLGDQVGLYGALEYLKQQNL